MELQRPYERGTPAARRCSAILPSTGVGTVATGNVHAHHPRGCGCRTLVAIHTRAPLDGCERERRNRESVLRPPAEMLERLGPLDPGAAARSAELADRLRFDLTEELGYRYPDFSDGTDPAIRQLAEVCRHAFDDRYAAANGLKAKARIRLDEELKLIDELGLAGFCCTGRCSSWRESARSKYAVATSPRRFLPGRGRGSSVGSIVCYLTGLSHVDPVASELLAGSLLNKELESVPDIDLDFPRDIREKLIVRVTERYGREHAALVASFATYRWRGAIRDVGKALGLPFAELERLARLGRLERKARRRGAGDAAGCRTEALAAGAPSRS